MTSHFVRSLAVMGLLSGSPLVAQVPESLLASARVRVAARDLDGARTLLARAADAAQGGGPTVRAEALMLLGLVHYYQGADSLARLAFGSALRLRPQARVPLVQEQDPDITRLLEQERCRLAAFEPTFTGTCVVTGLTAWPEIIAMPALAYPLALRDRGIEGRVWVSVIIDTLGDPVPGSVAVAESPDSGFDAVALEAVQGARFRPGVFGDRRVRAQVQVPIDFYIGGRETADSALPPVPAEPAVECLPNCPPGIEKPVLRSLLDLRSGPLRLGPTGALDGTVTIDALVRQDGRIDPEQTHMAAKGVPLETATTVLAAARKARFDPGRRDGRPIPARIRLRVTFVTPAGSPPHIDVTVL
jgi:TonB family protein